MVMRLVKNLFTGTNLLIIYWVLTALQDRPDPTIGAAFLLHKINVGDQTVRLEIWVPCFYCTILTILRILPDKKGNFVKIILLML